jgi:nitrite reductase/ring-hydroxylating ferredoxin subunit/uncharacterized membrane protein
MRSRASIKGHPVHAILVSFPIALLSSTLLLDVIAFFSNEQSFAPAAVYTGAGGIIFALLAAIPGIIDYRYSVPPDSSAKKRATRHGLTNTVMVLIFSLALYLKLKTEAGLPVIIALETIGTILIGIAGWMGGTLMVRNQIGIDHRYADAGKWQEETIRTSERSIRLENIDTLKTNQMRLLHVNGKRIALARTEKGLVAFDDRCTHRGASLADGAMICETVQCPWHGSQFSVTDGAVKAGPAKEKIRTYNIRAEDKEYRLEL